MKHRDIWGGEHRGVGFEVQRWQIGDKRAWNYYIHIPIEQLPEDARPAFNLRGKTTQFSPDGRKYLGYEYTGARIISDLDWHGGITFYEKHRDERGKVDGYKLGCDYLHLWDEDMEYDLDAVAREARASIDKLYEHIPDLRMRCTWDGRYYPAGEGSLNVNGNFLADVNKDKSATARASLAKPG